MLWRRQLRLGCERLGYFGLMLLLRRLLISVAFAISMDIAILIEARLEVACRDKEEEGWMRAMKGDSL